MTVALLEFDEQPPEVTPWDVIEGHLIRAGRLSPEGVGRRAQPRHCKACSARTLVGLDADWSALRAEADPQPVTALGEMLAHLEGRRTYALVNNASRHVLDYRDASRITHRPAGAGRHDVLIEHRCHGATRFPTAASNLTRSQALMPLTEGAPCPF